MTARTAKEALIAQLLGELDTLLHRVEVLPKQVNNAQEELALTVKALVAAGEKYRTVVTQFTEDAKTELSDFIERKAGNVAIKTAAERTELMEVARQAVAIEVEKLNIPTKTTTNNVRVGRLGSVIEHSITAAASSLVTAVIVYAIIKLQLPI